MRYYALSDIGKLRATNEDSMFAEAKGDDYLFIVCDGLGGHLSGEVASSLAVERISEYIFEHMDEDFYADRLRLIEDALLMANRSIVEEAKTSSDLTSMGTTAEVALIRAENLHIGHVGDSRIYLLRDGELRQLTRDHSLINDLIDAGTITLEESKTMGQRNIITRALGADSGLEVDLDKMELKPQDVLLLCSDGVTNGIEDDDIRDVLDQEIGPQEKAQMLIYMANASGGYDNATVVVGELR